MYDDQGDRRLTGSAARLSKATLGPSPWLDRLAATGPDPIDLSSLTVAMFSWGAMTPDLFPRLIAAAGGDVQLLEVFGQTESQSQSHRSPMITQGYYRNAEAFRDGWFHSGDSCEYVAADERAQVMVDRLKDVVKSGGENVSSIRVEGVLAEHPAVARVAVVGMPDEKWGELVTAVVIPAAGATVGEAELIAWARKRLAGFETPKRVVFATAMPETVGGKVRKHELREQLA